MSLHPDKIVALSSIANGASPTEREPVKSATVEQRAMNAARQRKFSALPKEPGGIETLAYQLRDMHWANHLKRLKQKVQTGQAGNSTPQPKPPQIVLQLPGAPMNG